MRIISINVGILGARERKIEAGQINPGIFRLAPVKSEFYGFGYGKVPVSSLKNGKSPIMNNLPPALVTLFFATTFSKR